MLYDRMSVALAEVVKRHVDILVIGKTTGGFWKFDSTSHAWPRLYIVLYYK